jgi:saccharopine dehydrogenase (NAD+, L-lysine-forming)
MCEQRLPKKIPKGNTVMRGTRSKTRLLLYGAYGYTGRLAAELAAATKLDLILAGRNKDALTPLGDRLSLPSRAIGLEDISRLSTALRDIACVVHMAGPFAVTSVPMLNACLATRTNYIDITGEIEVFEALWSRKEEIRRMGITVIPPVLMWFQAIALRGTWPAK